MNTLESFESKIHCLKNIFEKRFGCEFHVDHDPLYNCKVVSVFIKNKDKKSSVEFEGITIAYIKEFLGEYDIYQILKRREEKIIIFYPKKLC